MAHYTMRNSLRFTLRFRSVALCLALVNVLPNTSAQTPQSRDVDWSTIGDPGNRPILPQESSIGAGRGSVGYVYKMAKTEVTVGQWFEFVQAYAPFYDGPGENPALSGLWIGSTSTNPRSAADWIMSPGTENFPAMMSWRNAARYVNWLHNGKAANRAAFESGVYDTRTFGTNPDGTFNDQRARSAGATFWIPNADEWTKAMYFDPAKGGPGIEGYWQYPTSSDIPPIIALPELGGQSNSGLGPVGRLQMDVAKYSGITSPWGLLDGSGGVAEWTESAVGYEFGLTDRLTKGSSQNGLGPLNEWLGTGSSVNPDAYLFTGLRLAAIPSPSSTVSLICLHIAAVHRRRRT